MDAADTAGIARFERTVAMVRISDYDFYLLDVFRVVGGSDHAFFFHSTFGSLVVEDVDQNPVEPFGHGALLRDLRGGTPDHPDWAADWTLEDRYGVRATAPTDLHLRYTGLSPDVEVQTCEAWVNAASMDTQEEAWIPTLLLRRRAAAAVADGRAYADCLSSTFVGLIEPYEGVRVVRSVRRLDAVPGTDSGSPAGDAAVAVEVVLVDGRRDVLVSWPEPSEVAAPIRDATRLSWQRWAADGTLLDSWSATDGR